MKANEISPTVSLAEEFFTSPVYLNHARYLIEYRSSLIKEMLGNARPARILDIGCGDGSLSLPLLNGRSTLTLLDISGPMLESARKKTPATLLKQVGFVRGDFVDWASEERFDTIFCVGVLAHVPCADEVVAKISALLQPGGIAVIEVTEYNPALRKASDLLPLSRLRPGVRVGYRTNPLTAEQLVALAEKHALFAMKRLHYQINLPMSRFFPQWLLAMLVRRSAGELLSRFSSENMIFFQKSHY